MAKIVFIEHNGTQHVVEAEAGKSIMQVAVDNLVPGIVGDCGGCCTCATCHGYVEKSWCERLPAASDDEKMMIDGALHVEANSRLTCQLKVSEALDGIVIRLPESQF